MMARDFFNIQQIQHLDLPELRFPYMFVVRRGRQDQDSGEHCRNER
jgi:hypothetical protein